MKIVSNLNGDIKTTSYANKLFYRESSTGEYTQVKKAFYRDSPNEEYTQFYLYDEVAPSLTITSSSANTVKSSYILTARASDTDSGIASVTINNVPYSITSGSASVNISKYFTLSTGNNVFTITVIDFANNITTKSITVNYQESRPITATVTNNHFSQRWHFDGYTGYTINGTGYSTITVYSNAFTMSGANYLVCTYDKGSPFSWSTGVSSWSVSSGGKDVTSKCSLSVSYPSVTLNFSNLSSSERANAVFTATVYTNDSYLVNNSGNIYHTASGTFTITPTFSSTVTVKN